MTRRMLINAAHPEECRVAIAEDDHLIELEVQRTDQVQLKGNVYKAAITRIEPSLQAAFLDIGSNRNGFLQINDIHPSVFNNWPPEESNGRPPRPYIQDVLDAGQELVVQVVKDEREAKGATLTTNISIPGRYLVLMIGNQRGGVSRKINDESQRRKLKQSVHDLKLPPGMGVIVRTAGINKSYAELQEDLDGLLEIWFEILDKSRQVGHPKLLYSELDLATRTLRDYLTNDMEEILIDEPLMHEKALRFIEKMMPAFAPKVQLYQEMQPLFSRFHLDDQVSATHQPEVVLPSGGSIVINQTEAIVAIDVNSGRSTRQSDVENTAFETNKEAARVIAEQLRLRDLGGLVVIDFIDMIDRRHKQVIEKALKDAVRFDKAKVEVGRLSKFGLMEMSRQRLKTSLVSQSYVPCPHCAGRGAVKTPETAALEALRKIESAVCAGGVQTVRVRMAPAAALFLLNAKRRNLSRIENEMGIAIVVYADGRMKPEEYELELTSGKREIAKVTNLVAPPIQSGRRESSARSSESPDSQERSRGRDDRSRGRSTRTPRDAQPQERSDDQGRRGGRNRNRNDRRRSRGDRNNRDRRFAGARGPADQASPEAAPQGDETNFNRSEQPPIRRSDSASSEPERTEAPLIAKPE